MSLKDINWLWLIGLTLFLIFALMTKPESFVFLRAHWIGKKWHDVLAKGEWKVGRIRIPWHFAINLAWMAILIALIVVIFSSKP
jgi:hypothetical protein